MTYDQEEIPGRYASLYVGIIETGSVICFIFWYASKLISNKNPWTVITDSAIIRSVIPFYLIIALIVPILLIYSTCDVSSLTNFSINFFHVNNFKSFFQICRLQTCLFASSLSNFGYYFESQVFLWLLSSFWLQESIWTKTVPL